MDITSKLNQSLVMYLSRVWSRRKFIILSFPLNRYSEMITAKNRAADYVTEFCTGAKMFLKLGIERWLRCALVNWPSHFSDVGVYIPSDESWHKCESFVGAGLLVMRQKS